LPGAGVFIVFLPFRETLFVWKELNFSVFWFIFSLDVMNCVNFIIFHDNFQILNVAFLVSHFINKVLLVVTVKYSNWNDSPHTNFVTEMLLF
jgi:hypothetical protein